MTTAPTRYEHGHVVTGWRALALWAIVVADLLALIAFADYAPDDELAAKLLIGVLFGAVIAAFGAVGALLITRLPRNPFGWIYLVAATLIAWSLFGVAIVGLAVDRSDASIPLGIAVIAIVANADLVPVIGMVGIFVPLLFPTGRLASPRWRPVAWLAVLSIAWMTVVTMFAPGPLSGGGNIENPLGIEDLGEVAPTLLDVGGAGLVASFVLASISVVVRFRRSTGVERQQLRWFTALGVVMALCVVLGMSSIGPMAEGGWVVTLVALGLVPIATGVAILRYRLYDLDRIISRTLGWAIVSGLLVAVFAVGVVALQALLTGVTQGQSLAVAASTLVAFALFQPVRRRVQRAVDGRFDRASYDAERTAVAFAERLRDETDIEAVAGDLDTITRAALAPASLGIWLRESRQ